MVDEATDPCKACVRKFGWKPDKPDFRDHRLAMLPRKLQSSDLRPHMSPAYDQGETSSCVGHATAAGVEYDRKVQGLPQFQPSRLFIYYNARALEGSTQQPDAGAEIRDGIKSVVKWGVPKETTWKFSEDPEYVKKCPSDAAYAEATRSQITKYSRVGHSLGEIGTVLRSHPIVFGSMLYESFMSDKVGKDGIVPMPGRNEGAQGGHAMLLCGIDVDRRIFIVRNSWGPKWGVNGYCFFPYEYILNTDLTDDLWVMYTVEK